MERELASTSDLRCRQVVADPNVIAHEVKSYVQMFVCSKTGGLQRPWSTVLRTNARSRASVSNDSKHSDTKALPPPDKATLAVSSDTRRHFRNGSHARRASEGLEMGRHRHWCLRQARLSRCMEYCGTLPLSWYVHTYPTLHHTKRRPGSNVAGLGGLAAWPRGKHANDAFGAHSWTRHADQWRKHRVRVEKTHHPLTRQWSILVRSFCRESWLDSRSSQAAHRQRQPKAGPEEKQPMDGVR